MVYEELERRLNDGGYMNWVKAGQCLSLLRDGLLPFTTQHARAFHGDLLNHNTQLKKPCQTSACKPERNKFFPKCRACAEWQTEILRHRRQPDATLNWDNCVPPKWRSDYWELAKAFMPRGQGRGKGAEYCDAAALLNLINHCDCFHSVDSKCVREVIRFRNELMHSCKLHVGDDWMRHFRTSLTKLLQQLGGVPQIATAGKHIEEMLSVDLSIYVSGLDRMDSAALDGLESDSVLHWEISPVLIGKWEVELLQESLHESLHAADDDAKTRDLEQLKRLGGFLQANRDLGLRFSAELQAINSLHASE
ncbi:cxorf38 [Pungitius sinensis]